MYKITKKHLFLLAGIVWSFAGFQVMKVGIECISIQHLPMIYIAIGAVVIFAIFFKFIFFKMVKMHTKRINSLTNRKQPFYSFFDKKSYIIMICMMSVGILLRKSNILPTSFIAFFYTGLGAALFACGILYVYRWITFHETKPIIHE